VAKITKTFQYGKHEVTLETGEIARQASGAVVVKIDGTVLLVTAVAAKSAREGQDFFPLTVDYQEKFYAGGRIPGGFFKREGRQTEKEEPSHGRIAGRCFDARSRTQRLAVLLMAFRLPDNR